MGISFSSLLSAWKGVLTTKGLTEFMETMTVRSISFDKHKGGITLRTISFKNKENNTETTLKFDDSSNEVIIQEESMSFNKDDSNNRPKLNTTVSFKSLVLDNENVNISQRNDSELVHNKSKPTISLPEPAFIFSPHPVRQPTVPLPDPAFFFSPRPVSELDAAAVKLQKVYKSYRTRRNLADCAVVVEELWWKALDFADLKQSSISFFHTDKHETAVSRWSRARKRAAKVGKGLSKDEKAQKLALQHWLEAIDPRHRYGHNLHLYYDLWFESESTQPFFYWLDVGDGKEMNLEKCSRTNLQKQCIKYLGPKERETYEVIVEDGKLVNKQTGILVNTVVGSKWIFVLSTSRSLYVGQKKKGLFQHSSFLAGGATTSAGRLVAHDGVLEAIWPYSGHYLPTEENFKEFISFLEEHHVDLTDVKRCAADEDDPAAGSSMKESKPETVDALTSSESSGNLKEAEVTKLSDVITAAIDQEQEKKDRKAAKVEVPQPFEFSKRLSCKWSNGTGPRIGCVRDYPAELQFRALEQVNLSPRVTPGGFRNNCPIPSPRPSPKYRLSPRLAYMGIPSPRMSIPAAN